ncbi:MAG: alpha/beta hydrolase [Byssovorax sp.]
MRRLLLAAAAVLALAGCNYAPYASFHPAPAVASTPAMQRAQGSFEGVRGTRIFEQSWRPVTEPRAVLVVVHGLKDHSSRYGELAERLVREGYAVHALDLRGHAHSEGVRVDIESFDDYTGDLSIFLDRVRAAEPGKPIFVFGHSMGGAIVTLHQIEKKPDVKGLLLSGAALAVDLPGVKVAGTKFIAAIEPNAGIFNLDIDKFSRDKAVVEACKSDPLVYQDGAPARTARALLGAIDTIQERMGEITVPLLVMHGAADEVTPPQGSRDLVDRARSTDKTLKIYPNLVHDLVHEPEKEQVFTDIIAWLGARASR